MYVGTSLRNLHSKKKNKQPRSRTCRNKTNKKEWKRKKDGKKDKKDGKKYWSNRVIDNPDN